MTLTGRAMTWFTQLKLDITVDFKELAFLFTNSSINSKRRRPSLAALLQITQEDNEFLRKFVQLFSLTMNELSDLNISVAVITLI